MSVPFVIAPLIVFLAIFSCLVPVLVRLVRQCHLRDIAPDWLESFSPAIYQPMELLLAEEDFNFLVRQPGFEVAIGKKLRRDRVRIFRQYLNRLIADFNKLHVYACFRIAQNRETDQSALLSQLIWLRVRFSITVLRLQLSLTLAYFGFQPRLVTLVIQQLSEMNACLYAVQTA